MAHVVRHWADWLAATAVSHWLQDRLWIVPTSQSIHILMISVVFAAAVLLNLRLLGLSATGRPVSALVGAVVPWMYAALTVLLLTGIVQTVTEPVRQFVAPAFWWKMLMIVIVVALTRALQLAVRADPARWDGAGRPRAARLLALVSLALWIGIIYCGRFIAYTWESHL